MKAKFIHVKETASTNTYMAKMASMLPSATIIHTSRQTAGRGQRGNSWESEDDKNLTFSLLVKDITLSPAKQFYISEAVSVAMVNVLSQYADGFSIKWPNDIYFGDKKIAGILIENVLSGDKFAQSIIGIGLNVNQKQFVSDAPNPISLIQIIDTETNLDELMHKIGDALVNAVAPLCAPEINQEELESLHSEYLSIFYRKDNAFHTFILPDGKEIEAMILDVRPDGKMIIKDNADNESAYYFKEIAFKIN